MKCAIITVKLPDGSFDVLDISDNLTESKKLYNQIRQEQRLKERLHRADAKNDAPDYLAVFHNFQPQGRYISSAGFISESEAKEAEKVKRQKEKNVKDAVAKAEKAKAEEAAKAKADEDKQKNDEIEAKKKLQADKLAMEAKAQAKAEKAKKTTGKKA